ncbi:MAG: hypothetical protein WCW13_04660 [archaeon]|jgi:hypothetical protein
MINKIYILAHPLYTQNYTRDNPDYPRRSYATKSEKTITKNELHNYGLMIQEAKRNPNAILLFVELENIFPNSTFANEYKRLSKYAQKELAERFLPTPAAFGYGLKNSWNVSEAIRLTTLNLGKVKFSSPVTIEYTGQHPEYCAKRSAERIGDILDDRRIPTNLRIRKGSKGIHDLTEQLLEASALNKKRRLTKFSNWRRKTFGKNPRNVKNGSVTQRRVRKH